MDQDIIPFNWPFLTGKEQQHIAECHVNGRLSGDGPFTRSCHEWLQQHTGCKKARLPLVYGSVGDGRYSCGHSKR